jgi:uncharacterized protein
MDLVDTNVLIAAFRPDHVEHRRLKRSLELRLARPSSVTFPHFVEVAFERIVSHPKIFRQPSRFQEADAFLQAIRTSGAFEELSILPGFRKVLAELADKLRLAGNDLNDAYLAAIAIDSGFRLISIDEGFHRFPGLKWISPARTQWQ